jgi:prolyl 4-hydroxylase
MTNGGPQAGGYSAQVLEAARRDAEGRHAQAFELLREASARGDADAMAQLGKRFLVAFHAPYEPQQAQALILRAANLGSAEAAAQLAVLAAIGLAMPQDWNTALGALVFAAERGFVPARGQLCVLAGDRELARNSRLASEPDAASWARLAQSIDLNFWHHAPARSDLCDSPLVRRFPEFASAEVCEWMIAGSRGRLRRAQVYDAAAGRETEHASRSNTAAIFNLVHSDLVSVLVQVRICASTGVPFRFLEPCVVLHYDPGEEITEHYDFIDPDLPNYEQEIARNGQRIITFLVYLNDDYVGGETELPKLGVAHKGVRGEGMFFVNAFEDGRADTRTVHAGRPTSSGEKWVISQFIRNRPTF